jgi:hypothetical protein
MLRKLSKVLRRKPPEEARLMAARAAQKHQQKVGGGMFGQVYETSPGLVTKEMDMVGKQAFLEEINAQAKAAELGIAPQITQTTIGPIQAFGKTFPIEAGPNPKIRGEITMQDLRTNYIPLETSDDFYDPGLNKIQMKNANVETHKQLSQLALNGIKLGDRHGQNIFIHKMTGRPMQIDFGLVEELKTTSQKAGAITHHVANGLRAAGLPNEASTLTQLVNEVGEFNNMTMQYDKPEAALDMAKQGLSRLQKIKLPEIQQIEKWNKNQKRLM